MKDIKYVECADILQEAVALSEGAVIEELKILSQAKKSMKLLRKSLKNKSLSDSERRENIKAVKGDLEDLKEAVKKIPDDTALSVIGKWAATQLPQVLLYCGVQASIIKSGQKFYGAKSSLDIARAKNIAATGAGFLFGVKATRLILNAVNYSKAKDKGLSRKQIDTIVDAMIDCCNQLLKMKPEELAKLGARRTKKAINKADYAMYDV